MRFSITFLASAILSGSALASPLVASRANTDLAENSPWKLKNINIYESADPNTPSSISFDISDSNPGLKFKTHCSRTTANGESIYDGDSEYHDCGDASTYLSWYISSDKTIYIKRGYHNPAVGNPDFVTCFGNWGLNPHPFENRQPKWTGTLLGTNYTQECLSIYCTAMVA